eukprot:CAMPEP_0114489130 /NCGR_PEP_ID=MMETSP0109-20121206/1714_1 /TAXON_ID=29199 /ORGANISM="Chlorarachnion reptans, Strain CCCM449" /LENGTH=895 /DNA_ID=CAMNT_0001665599 /DNA_START=146 /DNA_END=2833 /DNA_ORIENTATION=-
MVDSVAVFRPQGVLEQEVMAEMDEWAKELQGLKKQILQVENTHRKFMIQRRIKLESSMGLDAKNGSPPPRCVEGDNSAYQCKSNASAASNKSYRQEIEDLARMATNFEQERENVNRSVIRTVRSRHERMNVYFTRIIQAHVGFLTSSYGNTGPLLKLAARKTGKFNSRHHHCNTDEIFASSFDQKKEVSDKKNGDLSSALSLDSLAILPKRKYFTLGRYSYVRGWEALYNTRCKTKETMHNDQGNPNSSNRRPGSSSKARRSYSTPNRRSGLSWFQRLGYWSRLRPGSEIETEGDEEEEESDDEVNAEDAANELRETVTSMAMNHKEAINAACVALERSERKRLSQEKEFRELTKDWRHATERAQKLAMEVSILRSRQDAARHQEEADIKLAKPESESCQIPLTPNTSAQTSGAPSITIACSPPGVPPPPPVFGGIPPPPPPMIGGSHGIPPPPSLGLSVVGHRRMSTKDRIEQLGLQVPQQWNPKAKMKRLHWTKVDATPLLLDSVWASMFKSPSNDKLRADFESQFKSEDFEKYFGSKSRHVSKRRKGDQQKRGVSMLEDSAMRLLNKPMKVKLIEARRRQNVSIVLKQFRGTPPHAIASALDTFDSKVLPSKRLDRLNTIFPSEEEINLVSAYTGDPRVLGEVEKFFLAMSKTGLREKLNVAVFLEEYPATTEILRQQLELMLNASRALMNSSELRRLLYIILNVGNYMNSGSRFGNAVGFQIDILPKLSRIKASDRKTTLLKFIVRMFNVKEHDFLKLSKSLHTAGRNSSMTLLSDLQHFAAKVKVNMTAVFGSQTSQRAEKLPNVWPPHAVEGMKKAKVECDTLLTLKGTCQDQFSDLRKLFMLEGTSWDPWEEVLKLCLQFSNDVASEAKVNVSKPSIMRRRKSNNLST